MGVRRDGERRSVECERLTPNVRLLKDEGYRVSVDTWSPTTAIATLEAGADMINYTGSQFPEDDAAGH